MALSISRVEISFVGSGEDADRAYAIIAAMRQHGRPVQGEAPWWSISYEDLETREAALTVLSGDLDAIDPGWRDVLGVR
jgi:hypothetical protein